MGRKKKKNKIRRITEAQYEEYVMSLKDSSPVFSKEDLETAVKKEEEK